MVIADICEKRNGRGVLNVKSRAYWVASQVSSIQSG